MACVPIILGIEMVEIRKQMNFLDKPSRRAKTFNMPEKGGKLSKDGKIWKNNYLATDLTDQYRTNKKIQA